MHGPAAAARPPPCAAPEHRQFDFWVGTWDVFGPAGRQVGANRIERIADGCALLEQWTGSGNVTGKSLNIYDASDGRWHQTWVDSSGTLLMLAGGLVGDSMVMSMYAERERSEDDGAAADHLDAGARRVGAAALGNLDGRRPDLGRGLRRPLRAREVARRRGAPLRPAAARALATASASVRAAGPKA